MAAWKTATRPHGNKPLLEGYCESRIGSRDTYPQSYITKYIRGQIAFFSSIQLHWSPPTCGTKEGIRT